MSGRIETLADGVLAGDRRSLARALTLVESERDVDRNAARELVERLHRGKGPVGGFTRPGADCVMRERLRNAAPR